ncbi:MAG: hypothetical protein EYC62_09280 [Alphaproteobacteria bacterium]|nr:MAG: hypothetical protein EYC62_09280 [Alphaproteobacteria bacterium]
MKNVAGQKKIILFSLTLLLILGQVTPSFAQAGNPFARPSAAASAPKAPEKKVETTPPVPVMPPKLLEPDEDELKNTFSDLNLVATAGSRAVLKAGDTVYYLRSGDYFTYEGTRVKVKVNGNKVQLFAEKTGDEVYLAEVGNGVVVSRSPETKKKEREETKTAENKSTTTTPPPATPGVKK